MDHYDFYATATPRPQATRAALVDIELNAATFAMLEETAKVYDVPLEAILEAVLEAAAPQAAAIAKAGSTSGPFVREVKIRRLTRSTFAFRLRRVAREIRELALHLTASQR